MSQNKRMIQFLAVAAIISFFPVGVSLYTGNIVMSFVFLAVIFLAILRILLLLRAPDSRDGSS